jgi:predicted HicB family RNase H-like nuclease
MKRLDTLFLLRLPEMLKAQCAVASAKADLYLSEWIRDAMETKLAKSLKKK